jgi:hypothetical protein
LKVDDKLSTFTEEELLVLYIARSKDLGLPALPVMQ